MLPEMGVELKAPNKPNQNKMGKALIIAEKPSVASDIAKALGGFAKKDDYFESERHVLSSAVGHLLELCLPEGVEVKRGKSELREFACHSAAF